MSSRPASRQDGGLPSSKLDVRPGSQQDARPNTSSSARVHFVERPPSRETGEQQPARPGSRQAWESDLGSTPIRPATAPMAILHERSSIHSNPSKGSTIPSSGGGIVKNMARPFTADSSSTISGRQQARLESLGQPTLPGSVGLPTLPEESTKSDDDERRSAGRKTGVRPPSTEAIRDSTQISMARIRHLESGFSMGTTKRNTLTGEIFIQKAFPWYSVVDIRNRADTSWTLHQCKNDQYLFKVLPLHYRTWIWHHFYKARDIKRLMRKDVSGNPYNQSVNLVLNERCVDATTSIGMFSPVMNYALVGMFSILAFDMNTTCLCVACLIVLTGASVMCNSPGLYWYSRFVTLPIRVAMFFYLLTALGSIQILLAYVGYLPSILVILVDFLSGDFKQFMHYRYLCRYAVVRELPGDLFVCRRIGAAHLEDTFGPRGKVSYDVAGFAMWRKSFTLICNLHGLLVELRPMQPDDWELVLEEFNRLKMQNGTATIYYYGLDVYDENRPTYESYEFDPVLEARMLRKVKKKTGLSQFFYDLITGDVDDQADEEEAQQLQDKGGKTEDEPLDPPLESVSTIPRS